mmetsp:Transcript_12441/g.29156  ORF Transcript_12441/g.29156 Transcript_12441/m.29156 type:complete len:282 (-) Transcript_12441:738-1583(-)
MRRGTAGRRIPQVWHLHRLDLFGTKPGVRMGMGGPAVFEPLPIQAARREEPQETPQGPHHLFCRRLPHPLCILCLLPSAGNRRCGCVRRCGRQTPRLVPKDRRHRGQVHLGCLRNRSRGSDRHLENEQLGRPQAGPFGARRGCLGQTLEIRNGRRQGSVQVGSGKPQGRHSGHDQNQGASGVLDANHDQHPGPLYKGEAGENHGGRNEGNARLVQETRNFVGCFLCDRRRGIHSQARGRKLRWCSLPPQRVLGGSTNSLQRSGLAPPGAKQGNSSTAQATR